MVLEQFGIATAPYAIISRDPQASGGGANHRADKVGNRKFTLWTGVAKVAFVCEAHW